VVAAATEGDAVLAGTEIQDVHRTLFSTSWNGCAGISVRNASASFDTKRFPLGVTIVSKSANGVDIRVHALDCCDTTLAHSRNVSDDCRLTKACSVLKHKTLDRRMLEGE